MKYSEYLHFQNEHILILQTSNNFFYVRPKIRINVRCARVYIIGWAKQLLFRKHLLGNLMIICIIIHYYFRFSQFILVFNFIRFYVKLFCRLLYLLLHARIKLFDLLNLSEQIEKFYSGKTIRMHDEEKRKY